MLALGPDCLGCDRWPMYTGQLEGINKRIKGIRRMADGYRNFDFSKLKPR